MIAVLAVEWRRWFATPRGWVLLGLAAWVSAWRFLSGLDTALFALEQHTELPVSVTRAVVLPVLAQTAVLVAFLAGLMAARLWAADRAAGTDRWWLSAPLSVPRVVLGQWLAASLLLLLVVLFSALIAASARLGAPIDLANLAAAVLGLGLLVLFAVALAGAVSALTPSPVLAALLALLALLALWAPDSAALARGADATVLSRISISRRLHVFLNGEVTAGNVGFFIGATMAALAVWIAAIARAAPWKRLGLAVLVAAVALAMIALLERGQWRWDWTASGHHTLQPQTRQLLARLEGGIEVLAPAAPGVPRAAIEAFFDRIGRHHPDLRLEWIDAGSEPERARALALDPDELMVRYEARETRLRSLSERTFAEALKQLARPSNSSIAYAFGGGERDLRGSANHDWGRFGAELAEAGMPVAPLDLVVNPVVPSDLDLLIVAAGDRPPVPGTDGAIVDYLAAGGRLWWLGDPGAMEHFPRLAAHLKVQQLPGTIVDARAGERGLGDPRFLLIARYPDHPVTRDLQQSTLFPIAAAWADPPASAQPLVETGPASWNETGPVAGAIQPGADDEVPGPLAVALAIQDGASRALVVGDGDFLSNRFIGNGGNAELGPRMVRWLLATESGGVPVRSAPDRHLDLDPRQVGLLGLLWLVIVPGLLMAVAVWRWWRRRA